SSTRARATALPMPRLPPVTNARFPASWRSMRVMLAQAPGLGNEPCTGRTRPGTPTSNRPARGGPVDSSQIATVDELLTTTRSVRRRLDLDRPVPDEVVLECLRLALQAPTGANAQNWRWPVVRDPATRLGLADLYRQAGGQPLLHPAAR